MWHTACGCSLRDVQVLDYQVQAEPVKRAGSSQSSSASSQRSSNLLKADLSYNCIDHIGSLSQHSNLQELILAGNQLKRIGSELASLRKLRKLELSSNSIRSCDGLQGGWLFHHLWHAVQVVYACRGATFAPVYHGFFIEGPHDCGWRAVFARSSIPGLQNSRCIDRLLQV